MRAVDGATNQVHLSQCELHKRRTAMVISATIYGARSVWMRGIEKGQNTTNTGYGTDKV